MSGIKNNTMIKLIMKVGGYILLSYILYLCANYIIVKDAKFPSKSDLRNAQDWFLFLFLFAIPVIIDLILVGLPMVYGFKRLAVSESKYPFYVLIIGLFAVEFIVTCTLSGVAPSALKVIISILLFIVFFWRRLW